MKKYLPILKNSPFFKGLTDNEIISILHCVNATTIYRKRGSYIFRAGDSTEVMGLVVSGCVLVMQEDLWGHRNILSKCHAGDFFGEPYAASPGAVLNVSVAADEDCEIIFLNVQRLLVSCPTACEHHQKLIRNLVSVLANKILILNDKITHVGKRTTRDKLLSYLSAESIRQSSLSFDIPFDRQQLADYLCIDRAAMSTEISKLQKEGFIKTNRNYFEKKKIDDLRLVMFCGEIMPNRHLNIWRKYYTKTEFVNLYGPTEAAYACTYFVVNRPFADNEPLPIGKPCENTDIIVLNENNTRVQQGEEGELCIRGTCLANGYYDNKEKTLQVFTQNPLNSLYEDKIYRTGDIVKYNEFGELEYVGRTDFQIKHLGYRIELGEIETATYGLDGIKQCCAIYQKEADKIVLFCVGDLEQTEKQIYTYLKEHIPRYMLPGKIILLQEMPLNANGKIDRLLLAGKIQL